jgi:hypothetical protein
MCCDCLEEYDPEPVSDEKMAEVIAAIKEVYAQEGGSTGGGLHIVLDDWNIEDYHVDYCLNWIQTDGFYGDNHAWRAVDLRCAKLLRELTEGQRASVMRKFGGCT